MPQGKPGDTYAVVDEDPYAPSITFWTDKDEAFEAWTQAWGNMSVSPLLLEINETGDRVGHLPRTTSGGLSNEELESRCDEYREAQ